MCPVIWCASARSRNWRDGCWWIVMAVAAVLVEQRLQRRCDVGAVLDQALRASVGLTNFALGAVAAEEPVVTQRPGVLFPSQPEALGGLLPKPLQLTGAHRHVRTKLQRAPDTGTRGVAIASLGAGGVRGDLEEGVLIDDPLELLQRGVPVHRQVRPGSHCDLQVAPQRQIN